MVASGPSCNDLNWTARFFQKLAMEPGADARWSPHYYCGTAGEALKFNTDQWYELLGRANEMEKLITDQWAVMGKFDPQHNIRLVIDEWGDWHKPGSEINPRHLYEQTSCLRDALVAALTLDTFNRHAEKVHGQTCPNWSTACMSLSWPTGTAWWNALYVFEMYKPHQGRPRCA